MKYSFLGIGFIMFGIFGLVFIVMFQSITINNESEYYVLKEAMEAAMLESVDMACYSLGDVNGEVYVFGDNTKKACNSDSVKIIEQKFVENFTRRFAASISGDVTEYELEFYDIMESPPKVTVVIKSRTQEYLLSPNESKDSFTIVNELSGILELNYDDADDGDTSDSDVKDDSGTLKGDLKPIEGGNLRPVEGGNSGLISDGSGSIGLH